MLPARNKCVLTVVGKYAALSQRVSGSRVVARGGAVRGRPRHPPRRGESSPGATVAVLRDDCLRNSRAYELDAQLFPTCGLLPIKPTGKAAPTHSNGERTWPAEHAAIVTVAQAGARLVLGWTVLWCIATPWRGVPPCGAARKNQRRNAVARLQVPLPLRHTYASLCIAAGVAPFRLSKFMGRANANVSTRTYAYLVENNNTDAMAASGATDKPTLAD